MLHQIYWVFIAERLFFTVFSNLGLVLALATVLSRNPVYSVISLIGLFVVCSAMMVLVGAEFLAFVYIVVYVGAVAVLFLFIIMMINVKSIPLKNNYNSNLFFLILVPILALSFFWSEYSLGEKEMNAYYDAHMGQSINLRRTYRSLDTFFMENCTKETFISATMTSPKVLGTSSFHYVFYHMIPILYGAKAGIPSLELYREAYPTFYLYFRIWALGGFYRSQALANLALYNPTPNIEAIGYALYVHYFFPFILTGIVLFIAMIGAIVITKYHRTESKKQETYAQIFTTGAVKKIKVPLF